MDFLVAPPQSKDVQAQSSFALGFRLQGFFKFRVLGCSVGFRDLGFRVQGFFKLRVFEVGVGTWSLDSEFRL